MEQMADYRAWRSPDNVGGECRDQLGPCIPPFGVGEVVSGHNVGAFNSHFSLRNSRSLNYDRAQNVDNVPRSLRTARCSICSHVFCAVQDLLHT